MRVLYKQQLKEIDSEFLEGKSESVKNILEQLTLIINELHNFDLQQVLTHKGIFLKISNIVTHIDGIIIVCTQFNYSMNEVSATVYVVDTNDIKKINEVLCLEILEANITKIEMDGKILGKIII
jgi:cytochrome c biogenesis protein ResB